mgnify:CR=1 FL=1
MFIPIDFPHERLACSQRIILFKGGHCIEQKGFWYILGYDPISEQDSVKGLVYHYLTSRRTLTFWPRWMSDLRRTWEDAMAQTDHPARYRSRVFMKVAILRGKMTQSETQKELADHARMRQATEDRWARPKTPKPI